MVTRYIVLILTTASAGVAAQGQVAPAGIGQSEVVVTARSREAAEALHDCLAQKCPPDEDIKATLDQSATQFVNGDYQASRATLYAARKRNGRFAKQYPVQVARLHGAIAMVSSHLGDGDAAWSGRLDSLGALKAGLPDNDPRVLLGRLDLADGYIFAGRSPSALSEYDAIARRARQLDLPTIEGAALLRRAQLLLALSKTDAAAYRRQARIAVADLAGLTVPALLPYATAARNLQIQLDTAGNVANLDRAIAAYRPAAKVRTPQLLYAPTIAINPVAGAANEVAYRFNPDGSLDTRANHLIRLPMADFEKQWIDVVFDIRADGRVTDVRIARQSPSLDGLWSKQVTDAIAGRRYAPMRIESGDRVARLERYTFMSLLQTATGTHVRGRSAKPRLQAIDLSDTLPG